MLIPLNSNIVVQASSKAMQVLGHYRIKTYIVILRREKMDYRVVS